MSLLHFPSTIRRLKRSGWLV